MARPCKCRRIGGEPPVTVFKPAGVPGRALQTVELPLDELEALRLADLEGLYQDSAAERMGVSRPTFSRLIAAARQKVADALLNSKALTFSGGNVVMAQARTFQCNTCNARFEAPCGTGRPAACPACGSMLLCRAEEDGRGRRCRGRGAGPAGAGSPNRCGQRRKAATQGLGGERPDQQIPNNEENQS